MSVCDECGTFCSPFCGGATVKAQKRLRDAKTEELIAEAKSIVLYVFANRGKVAAWEAVCELPPKSAQQFHAIEALEAAIAEEARR